MSYWFMVDCARQGDGALGIRRPIPSLILPLHTDLTPYPLNPGPEL